MPIKHIPFFSFEVEIKICILFAIAFLIVCNIFYDFQDIDKYDKKTTGTITSIEDTKDSFFGSETEIRVSYVVNGTNYNNYCTVKSSSKPKVGQPIKIAYRSNRPLKISVDGNNDTSSNSFASPWTTYVILVLCAFLIIRSKIFRK
ncbi:hypothetical protein [Eubacterium sp.]|uniref:hypothetical protein n=1 Tax=Eubacterium sp. TaxID=142586 RepID=UPI0025F81E9E|nr:hypothetical protein [Eubacterium sp.]MCR5630251.1 hypothetical protein [Eubacterium sp.]